MTVSPHFTAFKLGYLEAASYTTQRAYRLCESAVKVFQRSGNFVAGSEGLLRLNILIK